MEILKKNLAPLTDNAWNEITETLNVIRKNALTARTLVDIVGPTGIETSSVSTGRLKTPLKQVKDGVNFGIREVIPFVEVRKPFELDIWEMDNIERGAKNIDLEPLEEATKEMAMFEEKSIYEGFDPGGIKGFKNNSAYDNIQLPNSPFETVQKIGKEINHWKQQAIEGPYTLVLNETEWLKLLQPAPNYPAIQQVKEIIDGQIVVNNASKKSFLISERGGDFELNLGMDFTCGYDGHTSTKVKLFITSSFTFRVLNPEAVKVFDSEK